MSVLSDERQCARAREALSAALDGETAEADVTTAVGHVRLCPGCRDFVAVAVATTRALRGAYVIRPSSSGQRV